MDLDTGDSPDRRASYRLPCRLECRVAQRGMIWDISVGGVAINFLTPIPEGQTIFIRLAKDDPDLAEVEAEVVTCRQTGGAYVLHVHFVNMSPAVERALNRYMIRLQVRQVTSHVSGTVAKVRQ
jgi:c-di-GMP-binding flagellar brake protein YcgR